MSKTIRCEAACSLKTPIGVLRLTADAGGLTRVLFPNQKEWTLDVSGTSQEARGHIAEAKQALEDFFAGTRKEFGTLKLSPRGTAFQLSVWRALTAIPYGATCSYRDIAEKIGNVKAVRAVGLANGQNPIPIIIPCHRVIGSNGSLTGFGGGLETKQWLLVHEGAMTSSLF
mgnify:CR=1 FL=1